MKLTKVKVEVQRGAVTVQNVSTNVFTKCQNLKALLVNQSQGPEEDDVFTRKIETDLLKKKRLYSATATAP